MNQLIAEVLYRPSSEELRFLPECPRMLRHSWSGSQVLGWIAIQHGADQPTGSMNLLDLETRENQSIPLPGRPGFFAETSDPNLLLVGLERRLVLLNIHSGAVHETGIALPEGNRDIINDGMAVDGGLLFGTKHVQLQDPVGALYYYDSASAELRQLMDAQVCSNGKQFVRHADRVSIVDIDSLPKTITEYEFDSSLQRMLNRRLVVPPSSLDAFPDGLRPSPDGETVIVAFYNPDAVGSGSAQQMRKSDGSILTEWVLPGSPRVTCPEFVMVDGRVRVIFTTAVEGMSEETRRIAPEAGSLFWAETLFESLPALPPLFPL